MSKERFLLTIVLALILACVGCERKAPEPEVDEPEVPEMPVAQVLKGVDIALIDQQGGEVKLGDYAEVRP